MNLDKEKYSYSFFVFGNKDDWNYINWIDDIVCIFYDEYNFPLKLHEFNLVQEHVDILIYYLRNDLL